MGAFNPYEKPSSYARRKTGGKHRGWFFYVWRTIVFLWDTYDPNGIDRLKPWRDYYH